MKPAGQPLRASYRRLAILVLVLSAYWPTLRIGFLWDDHVMIEANPDLREWSVANVKRDFSSDPFSGLGDAYYRPLQTLANRVDYTVWKLHPFGYHLTNLLFHAANSVLAGELAVALGFGPLVALLAGCLFGVHPIGVEQLMIIAGRAELMTLCFSLINLLLFLQDGPWALGMGTAAYAMALLSKENAIVTPALFLLLSWYQKEKRSNRARWFAYLAVTVTYGIARSHAVGGHLPDIPVTYGSQFFVQAFGKIAALYVRLILVPWNLHSHRMIPHLSRVWFLYPLGWISLALWLRRKNIRWALLSLGWFLLCLLPKTPVMIMGNFILDHWAYPAAIGVILPLAIGTAWCWENHRRGWARYLAMAFFPILIVWALLVHLNVALRGTDEKMYRWALHFTESHPIKYNLGVLLLSTGRPQEAILYFEDVRSVYPEDIHNGYALALAYDQAGHRNVAIRLLKDLLKNNPTFQPAIQTLDRIRPRR